MQHSIFGSSVWVCHHPISCPTLVLLRTYRWSGWQMQCCRSWVYIPDPWSRSCMWRTAHFQQPRPAVHSCDAAVAAAAASSSSLVASRVFCSTPYNANSKHVRVLQDSRYQPPFDYSSGADTAAVRVPPHFFFRHKLSRSQPRSATPFRVDPRYWPT